MKRLLTVTNGKGFTASVLRTVFTFFIAIALGSGFWIASLPIAHAAQITPAEIIQSRLPATKTLADASDGQVLEAVYLSVKQSPKEAGLIVRTVAGARKTLRSELLCAAVRAQRDRHAVNCTWVANILREWIKSDPSKASQLTEATAQCAEECSETLQMKPSNEEGDANFVTPPSNINPPPGFVGGASASGTNQCIVCRNGRNMQIGCPAVDSFIRAHPGTTVGPCQVTPTTNL